MSIHDFRAAQLQTNKIISSGSTGTEANILIYPISAEVTGSPNTGQINPAAFATSSIGSDVFLFVSGAIDSTNVSGSHGVSVFGGDVFISGNIKVIGEGAGQLADLVYDTGAVVNGNVYNTFSGTIAAANLLGCTCRIRIVTASNPSIDSTLTTGSYNVSRIQFWSDKAESIPVLHFSGANLIGSTNLMFHNIIIKHEGSGSLCDSSAYPVNCVFTGRGGISSSIGGPIFKAIGGNRITVEFREQSQMLKSSSSVQSFFDGDNSTVIEIRSTVELDKNNTRNPSWKISDFCTSAARIVFYDNSNVPLQNDIATYMGSANGAPELGRRSNNGINQNNVTLSGTLNDYNPSFNFSTDVLRCNLSSDTDITGLLCAWYDPTLYPGQAFSREMKIVNAGSGSLTLKHQSSGSVAPNRFLMSVGTDIVLSANEGAWIYYDVNLTRWRAWKLAAPTTGIPTFSSWVRVSDMVSTGGSTVSNKTYRNSGNNFLKSAVTDKTGTSIFVKALYPSASLSSGSIVYQQLTADTDTDSYSGYISFTVSAITSSITASVYSLEGELGERYYFNVFLEAAPELTLVSLGTNGVTPASYPGAQTEFKNADTVSVYWTADKPVYTIQVQAGNGFASQTVSGIGGATSGTFTATTNYTGTSQQKSYITIRAANAAAAYGSYVSSWPTSPTGGTEGLNWMYANDLAPSFSFVSIVYPGSQGALKNSETADVSVTVTNFDTISYTSPGSEISIPSSTTYASTKTVTRIGGTYNISTNNFQIFATRAANNKSNTYNNVVKIANVAATCTVTEPATRLRSGGNDSTSEQSHVITATFNQQMVGAIHISGSSTPSVSNSQYANSGWTTTSWGGGTSVFTRTFKVHDDDSKGSYSWTVGASAYIGVNLAAIQTTTFNGDSSYTLGGFVSRDVSFSVFSQDANINVAVVDYSKVTAGIWTASGNASVKMSTQGDQTNTVEGYTIGTSIGVGLNTNPANVHWNDSVRASTNADAGNLAKLLSLQETA
jgi:hypothetical protein